jgi:septum formation protein
VDHLGWYFINGIFKNVFLAMAKFVLASQSPRRKQLLEWAEVDFEIMVHPTDESYPKVLSPKEVAIHIAVEKARAVFPLVPDKVVIAADTIVVLGNEIIGKPKDRQDAIAILSKLSGQHHQVITGVSIVSKDKEVFFADITDVEFHQLTKEQLTYYVDKYQPYDKAGAYAIQEWIGVIGIKRITGDFYNVMGLPVSRVVQSLQQFM